MNRNSGYSCLATMMLLLAPLGASVAMVSDGSDGAYAPGAGSHVIDLTLPGREDGILNFTSIDIPFGASITFRRNAANTPVSMLAQQDIRILGSIGVSASGSVAGPGGGEGGVGGVGDSACVAAECRPATAGGGVAGGNAGSNATPGGLKSSPGYAGSGGAMATSGLAADPARFPRSAVEKPALDVLPVPFAGGSGGGGGGGWMFFGVNLGGGGGGDGGGALYLGSSGKITLGGTLRANGANGGEGFANVGGAGGPGGGGSGGNFQLVGDSIVVLDSAVVEAIGGWGGCLSTEPCDRDRPGLSKLNNGGLGFFDLTARSIELSPDASIHAVTAVHVVPLPPAVGLFGAGLVIISARCRKRRANRD
jgi:hypothetical protein